jgi:hypothetical protein
MTIAVPTLSTLGFVTDNVNKFDFLLSYFYLSDYNQTYLYHDHVVSLPRIIEKNGNNINGVISDLKSNLDTFLRRYYDSAEITVEVGNVVGDNSSNITLNLGIVVTEKGIKSEYTRLLQSNNGKIQTISKLNNFSK